MKLSKVHASNFGSYENIAFDFENLDLALIYGPTGAGKSTVMDLICWTLFGITAKDGNADDVRSWGNSSGTKGSVYLWHLGTFFKIERTRGEGKNDLFMVSNPASPNEFVYRGKDLPETQALLNSTLGFTADQYLTGAYFSEFSPANRFFTAAASDRKKLFEDIADLKTALLIGERAKLKHKTLKADTATLSLTLSKEQGALENAMQAYDNQIEYFESWEVKKQEKIHRLGIEIENFQKTRESELATTLTKLNLFQKRKEDGILKCEDELKHIKQNIKTIEDHACPTCKNPKSKTLRDKYDTQLQRTLALEAQLKHLNEQTNPHTIKMEDVATRVNGLDAILASTKEEPNPFKAQIDSQAKNLSRLSKRVENTKNQHEENTVVLSQLDRLYKLSLELKTILVKDAIKQIEFNTNKYLENHFDSQIRVKFVAEKADQLSCTIQKDGNECSFKQLSKGQRALLKLCFSVSVMSSSTNNSGLEFKNLFFDESLDGMDAELKIKAYDLFQELSLNKDSILVIDHSQELQNLFETKFHVTIDTGSSKIERED